MGVDTLTVTCDGARWSYAGELCHGEEIYACAVQRNGCNFRKIHVCASFDSICSFAGCCSVTKMLRLLMM